LRSEHWNQRTSLFKEELNSISKNGMVFLGDSITEEFNLSYFFPKLSIINRGIGGDSINSVIERINYSAIELKPSTLFLMIGVNDLASDFDSEYIKSGYKKLLSLIESGLPDSRIIVQSILPCTSKWGNAMTKQIKQTNNFLFELCQTRKIEYLNLFDRFINSDGQLMNELTTDGLHLNTKGYEIWAKILKETFATNETKNN